MEYNFYKEQVLHLKKCITLFLKTHSLSRLYRDFANELPFADDARQRYIADRIREILIEIAALREPKARLERPNTRQ